MSHKEFFLTKRKLLGSKLIEESIQLPYRLRYGGVSTLFGDK